MTSFARHHQWPPCFVKNKRRHPSPRARANRHHGLSLLHATTANCFEMSGIERRKRSGNRCKVVHNADVGAIRLSCNAVCGKSPSVIGKTDFRLIGYRRYSQTNARQFRVSQRELTPILP